MNFGIEFIAFRYVGFSRGATPSHRLLARNIMPADVARANLIAATRADLGYDIFHIGPETPLTQSDIAQAVTDPYGVVERHWPGSAEALRAAGVKLKFDDFWPVTRTDRAKRVLGWRPEATFETYLRSIGWDGRAA
ncbi:MAG: hypothetical protein AB1696_15285 [Planctomycetota bacterium]